MVCRFIVMLIYRLGIRRVAKRAREFPGWCSVLMGGAQEKTEGECSNVKAPVL